MEKWLPAEATAGDWIRVSRGSYYHHGICIGDDVIHYSAPDDDGLTGGTVIVRKTTLAGFLRGGFLEVRRYTVSEKMHKRKPAEIVAAASAQLGDGGYDVIYNNCEHFASRCVFGRESSAQVDEYRKQVRKALGKE